MKCLETVFASMADDPNNDLLNVFKQCHLKSPLAMP